MKTPKKPFIVIIEASEAFKDLNKEFEAKLTGFLGFHKVKAKSGKQAEVIARHRIIENLLSNTDPFGWYLIKDKKIRVSKSHKKLLELFEFDHSSNEKS